MPFQTILPIRLRQGSVIIAIIIKGLGNKSDSLASINYINMKDYILRTEYPLRAEGYFIILYNTSAINTMPNRHFILDYFVSVTTVVHHAQ